MQIQVFFSASFNVILVPFDSFVDFVIFFWSLGAQLALNKSPVSPLFVVFTVEWRYLTEESMWPQNYTNLSNRQDRHFRFTHPIIIFSLLCMKFFCLFRFLLHNNCNLWSNNRTKQKKRKKVRRECGPKSRLIAPLSSLSLSYFFLKFLFVLFFLLLLSHNVN